MVTLDPQKIEIHHMNIFHMKTSQIMACECILENRPSMHQKFLPVHDIHTHALS